MNKKDEDLQVEQEIKEKESMIDAEEAQEEWLADPSLSEGTELEAFEAVEIEEQEFLNDQSVESIIESLLFATDKPISFAAIRQVFKGTNIKPDKVRKAIERLAMEHASPSRGVSLEEINGGYQLRTKVDNVEYMRRLQKARPFKLSGPALEVLAIVAYKQPVIKSEVDQIRGVESGHLMRALMDRSLIKFAGKSDFPGKPMLYDTTRKFLETFGLRSLKELPTLNEIDELLPDGIGEIEEDKENLSDVSDQMGLEQGHSYSESEEELSSITDKLSEIDTSSAFFEEEKARQKAKKEAERAQDIQEALDVGEEVANKDQKWLQNYQARRAEELAESVESQDANTDEVAEEPSFAQISAETVEQDESEQVFTEQQDREDRPSIEEIAKQALAAFEDPQGGIEIDIPTEKKQEE